VAYAGEHLFNIYSMTGNHLCHLLATPSRLCFVLVANALDHIPGELEELPDPRRRGLDHCAR